MIDEVNYKCKISHHLEKQLKGQLPLASDKPSYKSYANESSFHNAPDYSSSTYMSSFAKSFPPQASISSQVPQYLLPPPVSTFSGRERELILTPRSDGFTPLTRSPPVFESNAAGLSTIFNNNNNQLALKGPGATQSRPMSRLSTADGNLDSSFQYGSQNSPPPPSRSLLTDNDKLFTASTSAPGSMQSSTFNYGRAQAPAQAQSLPNYPANSSAYYVQPPQGLNNLDQSRLFNAPNSARQTPQHHHHQQQLQQQYFQPKNAYAASSQVFDQEDMFYLPSQSSSTNVTPSHANGVNSSRSSDMTSNYVGGLSASSGSRFASSSSRSSSNANLRSVSSRTPPITPRDPTTLLLPQSSQIVSDGASVKSNGSGDGIASEATYLQSRQDYFNASVGRTNNNFAGLTTASVNSQFHLPLERLNNGYNHNNGLFPSKDTLGLEDGLLEMSLNR